MKTIIATAVFLLIVLQLSSQEISKTRLSESDPHGLYLNAFYLKNIPVRAYCEPDIHYHLEKCEDYFDMNASDLSAMINCLKALGNNSAELIATENKGYRLDGTRHPHSWSILDSKDCVEWIEKIIKEE